MLEKTRDDYMATAARFFRLCRKDRGRNDINFADVIAVLDNQARKWSRTYWAKNRLALAFFFAEEGYGEYADNLNSMFYRNPETQIWDEENQRWIWNKNGRPGKKQNRVKKVTKEEIEKLIEEAKRVGNLDVVAAICIATICGCRPSEMSTIELKNNYVFLINKTKESTSGKNAGKRALDRLIKFDDRQEAIRFNEAINRLRGKKIENIQKNVYAAAERVWPTRKHRPSLYSMRNQFCSNLKVSGFSRIEIAYLMGHQVTSSSETYGDRRAGRKGEIVISPAVSLEIMKEKVRVDHLSDIEIENKRNGRSADNEDRIRPR